MEGLSSIPSPGFPSSLSRSLVFVSKLLSLDINSSLSEFIFFRATAYKTVGMRVTGVSHGQINLEKIETEKELS